MTAVLVAAVVWAVVAPPLAFLLGRAIRLADQRRPDATPCARCRGERWICEDHPDWPWNGGEGCGNPTDCCRQHPFPGQAAGDPCPFIDGCHGGLPCETAGAPCPDCNELANAHPSVLIGGRWVPIGDGPIPLEPRR